LEQLKANGGEIILEQLKVGYFVKMYPRLSETFILNEILELERRGVEVVIFSMLRPNEERHHPQVAQVKAPVHYLDGPKVKGGWSVLRKHWPTLWPRREHLWELLEERIANDNADSLKLFSGAGMAAADKIKLVYNGINLDFFNSVEGSAREEGLILAVGSLVAKSPSFPLIRALVGAGSLVTAYDPKTNEAVHDMLGGEVLISDDQYASIEGAEALVVATDWEEFKQVDLLRIRGLMRRPVIFDGRNIYDPKVMSELGFTYYGVGRITHPPKPVAKSARQVERDYSLVMGD